MNREVRVGMMFVAAAAIMALAVVFLGRFQEQVTYKVRFSKVLGLTRDAPVQFNGVSIGRVTKIVLAEQNLGDDPSIIVHLAVHRSVRQHIRASTTADIKSVGILGDKSVLLLTEDYGSEILPEDSFIDPAPKMVDMDKLLEQGTDMVADATAITRDLRTLLDRMANEDGPFQSVIGDQQMAAEMRAAVTRLLAYVENEDTLLALMMDDPEFAQKVEQRLDRITAEIDTFSSRVNEGQGLLPMMLEDEDFKKDVQARILSTLDNSEALTQQLLEGEGLLHKMTTDKEYGDRVAANLEKASYHLASILEKMDQGDGTASLMINDPSLYQGVYEVVYGLKNSGIAKWYIQRKQRQGARKLEKEKN